MKMTLDKRHGTVSLTDRKMDSSSTLLLQYLKLEWGPVTFFCPALNPPERIWPKNNCTAYVRKYFCTSSWQTLIEIHQALLEKKFEMKNVHGRRATGSVTLKSDPVEKNDSPGHFSTFKCLPRSFFNVKKWQRSNFNTTFWTKGRE